MASVVVTAGPPVAVQPDHPMSEEEWRLYVSAVWVARLDAQMHQQYFAFVRRLLGGTRFVLELVVTFGSAGAVATIIAELPRPLMIGTTIVVAVCAAILQIAAIADRARSAADLVDGWSARSRYWDDAWLMVQGGAWLGPLSAVREPEQELVRLEETLGFLNIEFLQARVQRHIMRTDQLAAAAVTSSAP